MNWAWVPVLNLDGRRLATEQLSTEDQETGLPWSGDHIMTTGFAEKREKCGKRGSIGDATSQRSLSA